MPVPLRGKALVAQSGGPTTVINSSACGVIQEALAHPEITGVLGANHGILGVLEEDLFDLAAEAPETIAGLRSTPSSAIGSCRYKLGQLDQDRGKYERLLDVFKAHEIRWFFYIGGNDSMDTADKVNRLATDLAYELRVLGVPKTIDNDLDFTDHCPGYGSVAKFLATATMEVGRDTEAMHTFDPVTIMEVMGRNTGWIAAACGLARRADPDAPHLICVPEIPFNRDRFLADLEAVLAKHQGACVVVSEGLKDEKGEYLKAEKGEFGADRFGHQQLGGVAEYLKELVELRLRVKCRCNKLGTCQRNAMHWASRTDSDEAHLCGRQAVRHAVAGTTGMMITLVRERQTPYHCGTGLASLADVANSVKPLPRAFMNDAGNQITQAMRDYALPLIQGEVPLRIGADGLPVFTRFQRRGAEKTGRLASKLSRNMGALNFDLPSQLSTEDVRALARSYLMGGAEYMPWLTEVRQQPGNLSVRTHINESGCLCAPWQVNGHGRLVLATATLMNRTAPYHLALELARGKVNHLRAQAADWESGSLQISPLLAEQLRQVAVTFARAVCSQEAPDESLQLAVDAINQAIVAGDALVQTYIEQVFQLRQQREPRLATALVCRVTGTPPTAEQTQLIRQTFNAVQIPLIWPTIEPSESGYEWEAHDALFNWAKTNGFRIVGGPIIDFSPHSLPHWLGQYQSDLRRIINFMEDYVEMALQRYGTDVRVWQLTAASNAPSVLALGKDDLLRLTNRLHDTAQQLSPEVALILGITQPWGECLTQEEKAYFPFVFADTLLRNRARVTSLDLEIVMGVGQRGSYARDMLEISRILDVYALLSLPIRVTLACPSALTPDAKADPDYPVDPRGSDPEWSPQVQADWAERVGALAVCKPYVEGVTWAHFADAEPHQFPHSGLIDQQGQPKPALEPLRRLRQTYLT